MEKDFNMSQHSERHLSEETDLILNGSNYETNKYIFKLMKFWYVFWKGIGVSLIISLIGIFGFMLLWFFPLYAKTIVVHSETAKDDIFYTDYLWTFDTFELVWVILIPSIVIFLYIWIIIADKYASGYSRDKERGRNC